MLDSFGRIVAVDPCAGSLAPTMCFLAQKRSRFAGISPSSQGIDCQSNFFQADHVQEAGLALFGENHRGESRPSSLMTVLPTSHNRKMGPARGAEQTGGRRRIPGSLPASAPRDWFQILRPMRIPYCR